MQTDVLAVLDRLAEAEARMTKELWVAVALLRNAAPALVAALRALLNERKANYDADCNVEGSLIIYTDALQRTEDALAELARVGQREGAE